MASKICPSCGAKNPDNAYICKNCAASLLDLSPASVPATTSATWSQPQESTPFGSNPIPSPTTQVDNETATGGLPIAVVRQSPVGGILNALGSVIYLLIFGLGAGIAFGGELVSIVIIVAVIVVPMILGYLFRPTYEFYDSYMLRVSRSGKKQFDYSQMQSISKTRGSIRIILKEDIEHQFRRPRLIIPGNPRLADGTDLDTWLKAKVPEVKTNQSESPENVRTEDSQ